MTIYQIGSSTPAASFNNASGSTPIASGSAIGILPSESNQFNVIDLSGSIPLETSYSTPIASLKAFAATSASQWMVGNGSGVLLDGASLPTTPRYFGQGAALSIAGSTNNVAISTAIGQISIFHPYLSTLDETISAASEELALSSDGTVLGASVFPNSTSYQPARTLNFYSLPSENVVSTFPHSGLLSFSLAATGTTIGQVFTGTGVTQQATDITSATVIWSNTVGNATSPMSPVLFSPDGTLIAAYTGSPDPTTTTNIFQNGTIVTTVPGAAVGWIDNNRLLVDQYTYIGGMIDFEYSGSTIYSSTGTVPATPALPQMGSIQTVGTDSVYNPGLNAIYSLTTGQPTWTGSYDYLGVGAVSGAYVVYETRQGVVVESY